MEAGGGEVPKLKPRDMLAGGWPKVMGLGGLAGLPAAAWLGVAGTGGAAPHWKEAGARKAGCDAVAGGALVINGGGGEPKEKAGWVEVGAPALGLPKVKVGLAGAASDPPKVKVGLAGAAQVPPKVAAAPTSPGAKPNVKAGFALASARIRGAPNVGMETAAPMAGAEPKE